MGTFNRINFSNMESIYLAVAKGRILKEFTHYAEKVGLHFDGDTQTDRRLIFSTSYRGIEINLVVVRAQDVPAYVDHGAVDMGIVGKDVLLEFCAITTTNW